MKIQSPKIRHDNSMSKKVLSECGRMQIYDLNTNVLIQDLYYKQLYISLEENYVDGLIILKDAIR